MECWSSLNHFSFDDNKTQYERQKLLVCTFDFKLEDSFSINAS